MRVGPPLHFFLVFSVHLLLFPAVFFGLEHGRGSERHGWWGAALFVAGQRVCPPPHSWYLLARPATACFGSPPLTTPGHHFLWGGAELLGSVFGGVDARVAGEVLHRNAGALAPTGRQLFALERQQCTATDWSVCEPQRFPKAAREPHCVSCRVVSCRACRVSNTAARPRPTCRRATRTISSRS